MPEYNPFIRNQQYPDATAIFSLQNLPIAQVKSDCLYVIDTNALLLFYQSSATNLTALIDILESLIERNRIFIPGQVAREFASNRPDRIRELFQVLNRKMNSIPEFPASPGSILNTIDEFNDLIKLEETFNELTRSIRKQYRDQLNRVLDAVKKWSWNDQVSEFFRETFVESCVIDPNFNESEMKEELSRRVLHKIPPGYKDQAKADDGIGDLIIWFTILELAKKHKKHVVFVSGEEKADWVIKSEGQVLCPRYELVYEFHQASEGKSFHVTRLSEFIELTSNSARLIKEMRAIEKRHYTMNEFMRFEVASPDAGDSYLTRITVERIKHELGRFRTTMLEFLEQRSPGNFGKADMLRDLTRLHRSSIIPYKVYSRLMFFFSSYDSGKEFTIEQHQAHQQEIEKLKILAYEAFAEADFTKLSEY